MKYLITKRGEIGTAHPQEARRKQNNTAEFKSDLMSY